MQLISSACSSLRQKHTQIAEADWLLLHSWKATAKIYRILHTCQALILASVPKKHKNYDKIVQFYFEVNSLSRNNLILLYGKAGLVEVVSKV
jgi:hypothetical protein